MAVQSAAVSLVPRRDTNSGCIPPGTLGTSATVPSVQPTRGFELQTRKDKIETS